MDNKVMKFFLLFCFSEVAFRTRLTILQSFYLILKEINLIPFSEEIELFGVILLSKKSFLKTQIGSTLNRKIFFLPKFSLAVKLQNLLFKKMICCKKEENQKDISQCKYKLQVQMFFGIRWAINNINKGNCRRTIRRLLYVSAPACFFYLFLYFFGSENMQPIFG